MDSILLTIKKMLGLDSEYRAFDTDLIVNINGVLMTLTQLGVGPADGFSITGEAENWEDFIGVPAKIEAVKTYIYLKVKAVFDPPSSSYVVESMAKQASELEWRILVQAEAY